MSMKWMSERFQLLSFCFHVGSFCFQCLQLAVNKTIWFGIFHVVGHWRWAKRPGEELGWNTWFSLHSDLALVHYILSGIVFVWKRHIVGGLEWERLFKGGQIWRPLDELQWAEMYSFKMFTTIMCVQWTVLTSRVALSMNLSGIRPAFPYTQSVIQNKLSWKTDPRL